MITTPLVTLRPYTAADRGFFVALNTDPVVREHANGPLAPDAAGALFGRILATHPPPHAFAITLTGDDTPVGHLFLDHDPDTPGTLELGFLLTPAVWNQGIATSAATAALPYAFDTLGASTVTATVDHGHRASLRVLEKAGLTHTADATDEHGPYHVFTLTRA